MDDEVYSRLMKSLETTAVVVKNNKLLYKGPWLLCMNFAKDWMDQRHLDWDYDNIRMYLQISKLEDLPKAAQVLYGDKEDGKI